ncbi:MAG: glutamate-cysteine ligase family protein [Myxococcota bacterium]
MKMTTDGLTRDALLAQYQSSGRPRAGWLVGAEFERHLLDEHGRPLRYHVPHGIRWMLESLAAHRGELVYEAEYPIALSRERASVTLEPGGQFELSGSPHATLQPIHDEAAEFSEEVEGLLGDDGIHQVAIGFTPFTRITDIEWVPKGRYAMMKEHLGRTGRLAHHMMKGTAAIQATYDYADEADAARKVGLATRLGPLTTAMFANSPWAEGQASGFMSYRGHIWTQTDPARTGLPDSVEAFSFERWLDYLLGVPMMFVKDDGRYVPANGQTFGQWMAGGRSRAPTWDDWDLHLTSVFPEVRVKHTIEVRGADCVPLPLAMSFVGLFKGLFYCDIALEAATEMVERFVRHGTKDERFAIACRDGLQGEIGGRKLVSWAEELVQMADGALQRCAPEDRAWLRPLAAQIYRGESPARTLLRTYGPEPSPDALLASSHVVG